VSSFKKFKKILNKYAIILAGGKGTRIKSHTPKQFIELCGKPILLHTIEAFYRYDLNVQVIVVLPKIDMKYWEALVKKFKVSNSIMVAEGGETRFQSVKNGLHKINGEGHVAIHDGVRPLVSETIIGESFNIAYTHQSAVTAVDLKDSIRIKDQNSTKAMDRSKFKLIQTPQTFEVSLIKKAYEQPEDSSLTDDASVAERAGHCIVLFEGSYENIKITTPEDLVIAEALLKSKAGL
jgi:2-C-methyl-D-erythritol 4-phosphate cytidylyltransferase